MYTILSYLFYYIGHFMCKIAYTKIRNYYPFDFAFMYIIYNRSMQLSIYFSDKSPNGPWNKTV